MTNENEIAVLIRAMGELNNRLTEAERKIANLEQINEVRVKTETKLRRQVSEIHRDRETHD